MFRTTAFVLLVALGLSLSQPAMAQDPDENLAFKIHEAIRTGVNWLKAQQKPDGTFGESSGPTYTGGSNAYHNRPAICAFSLFTLLSCEVPVNDPVISKGFGFLRQCDPKGTYEHAVMVLAFEKLWHRALQEYALKKYKKNLKSRKRFLKGKYAFHMMKKSGLGMKDRELVAKLTSKLVNWQHANQGWRYGDLQGNAGDQDVSATQFVVFGLKASTRCGIGVAKQVFFNSVQYYLTEQEVNGVAVKKENSLKGDPKGEGGSTGTFIPITGDKARGWPYMKDSAEAREKRIMGGMTAAALVGLIIAKSELQKTRYWKAIGKKADRAIFDGLAWLNMNWTVENNPYGFRGHYYYLYALERVGILGGITMIGSHNWYIDGAKYLVGAQQSVDKDNGFWDVKQEIAPSDIFNTCYALLFLKKATIPVGVTITRGGR